MKKRMAKGEGLKDRSQSAKEIIFLCLLPFAFCLLPFDLSVNAADISVVPVSSIKVTDLFSISESELLYLLNINKGSVLDMSQLSAGVKRAFLKGIFEDIIIESSGPSHAAISIIVKEKPVIDSISVRGNDYFSARFIKNQLGFDTGERLNDLKIRESVARAKDALRQRGFVKAGIAYAVKPGRNNKAALELVISEGQPEVIRQIIVPSHNDIVGNYLTLSPGDIFDLTKMDAFRNKVLQYCKKEAFVGSSLSYTFDRGVLSINLDPGRKLIVTFSGNEKIKSGELMKEVPFFEINEISDDLIEETIARIISLYHRNGFLFIQAAPVVSTVDDVTKLDIFIFEGDRYRVQAVNFEGVSIPQDKLKDILISRAGDYYNPDNLESDENNLIDYYRALGYLNMEVHEPEIAIHDKDVTIRFDVSEKEPVKITDIAISGAKAISDAELLKAIPLKAGNPYNEVDISDSRRKIIEMYNQRGYREAKVTVEREIMDLSAKVEFDVEEGNLTLFGKSIIVGNEKTKELVIQREFIHKMNDPFDYSKLIQEKQRLYRLGLFTDVEVVPSEKSDGQRDILYKFKEADAGSFDFGVGYGEYERYRGFLGLSYRNLFGLDRQASIRTEASSLEKRVILSYSEPHFLNRELTLKALALFENKIEKNFDTGVTSYRLTRETASVGVEKKLSDSLKGDLYYDFSVVKTKDVQPDIVLSREDTGSLIISGLRPEFIYDTRDNPFDPKKGFLAGLSFKAASHVFFSQTDFLKTLLYVNRYQSLSKRIVLAVSLRGGAAQGFRNTNALPIVERFFLGGRTTVRGYDQDTLGPKGADGTPIGGNAFLMGNFELRTDVGRGFGIVTFVDTGNVYDKIKDISVTSLKFTTGLGLRYNTPVGPIRVDYGVKLSRQSGESFGALHFSIGQAF